jgi:filamentous hemagglutinin
LQRLYLKLRKKLLRKVLATLGEGEVTIGGVKTQTPSTLNRDTDNVDKDIYKVEQSNSIEMTVDHRLLSEDGRKEIKEDFRETGKGMQKIDKVLPSATNDNAALAMVNYSK